MTDETKHTPGPWTLGGKDGDGHGADGYIYCDDATGAAVAIAFGKKLRFSTFSHTQELANARLIAAAPELLAALIAVNDKLRMLVWDGSDHPLIKDAEAAIAKAEGRSK